MYSNLTVKSEIGHKCKEDMKVHSKFMEDSIWDGHSSILQPMPVQTMLKYGMVAPVIGILI
jgi:hypothetical protein